MGKEHENIINNIQRLATEGMSAEVAYDYLVKGEKITDPQKISEFLNSNGAYHSTIHNGNLEAISNPNDFGAHPRYIPLKKVQPIGPREF